MSWSTISSPSLGGSWAGWAICSIPIYAVAQRRVSGEGVCLRCSLLVVVVVVVKRKGGEPRKKERTKANLISHADDAEDNNGGDDDGGGVMVAELSSSPHREYPPMQSQAWSQYCGGRDGP